MIKVRNKVLAIPENELTIAAAGDKGSVNRVFQIPRVQPDGVDLANMIFKLGILYLDTNEKDRDDLDKVISDDYVTLTWTISSLTSSHTGNAYIQLCAMTDTGSMRWKSFQAAVYIESSIETEKTTIGLSELEDLERRIDEKANALDTAEAARVEAENGRAAAENSREAAEATRKAAEAARQNTFDSNEELRRNTFEVAETARKNTFETAEAARQEAFKEKEAGRQSTFDTNEALRQAGYDERIADFDKDRQELKGYATLSESWAIGGTGTRTGEDTNNSKYYSEKAGEDARAAAISAEKASSYAKITAPDFYLDIDTGKLYMKGGVGVEFVLSEGKLYWKIA